MPVPSKRRKRDPRLEEESSLANHNFRNQPCKCANPADNKHTRPLRLPFFLFFSFFISASDTRNKRRVEDNGTIIRTQVVVPSSLRNVGWIDASRFSGGFNNGASHVRERGRGGGGGWIWAGALRGAGLSDPRGGGNAKVDRNDRKLGNASSSPCVFFSRFSSPSSITSDSNFRTNEWIIPVWLKVRRAGLSTRDREKGVPERKLEKFREEIRNAVIRKV